MTLKSRCRTVHWLTWNASACINSGCWILTLWSPMHSWLRLTEFIFSKVPHHSTNGEASMTLWVLGLDSRQHADVRPLPAIPPPDFVPDL